MLKAIGVLVTMNAVMLSATGVVAGMNTVMLSAFLSHTVDEHCHAERSEASRQFTMLNTAGYCPELSEGTE
jgi:hypothetical protein